MKRGATALLATLLGLSLAAPPAQASFGFLPGPEGFSATPLAEGGGPAKAAGAHPYEMQTSIAFNLAPPSAQQKGSFTEGDLRDLAIELPGGLIENPAALPKCREAEFTTPRTSPYEASASGESCPATTQIGVLTLHTSYGGGETRSFGLFDLTPPPGVPAAFGAAPYGVPLVFETQIRAGAGGEYSLSAEAQNIHQSLDLYSLELTIWGVPWGVSHDGQRGNCLNEREPSFPWAKCSLGSGESAKPVPYLSLPTYCGQPLAFTAAADSWQDPTEVRRTYEAPALEACETVPFDPQAVGQITNPRASSPSGFAFTLTNNNEGLLGPILRAPSQTKTAVVSLPEGVTLNPSLGAGLGVCTPPQYGAETAFSPQGAGCPNNSKIGEFTVQSPLYEGEISGALYLAKPTENPFSTLLAVYLVAKAPQRGILVKLAGKLVPDPQSGQLTATFEDLPQLPYTNLVIHFREGQRAPLVSPPACGTFYTYSALTPWLGALGEFHRKAYSTIERGISGGPCPTGGAPPFQPGAKGGTLNPVAGAYAPFYLHLTRTDAEQEITSYSTVFPAGLLGKIAGVPYCPDQAIEAAKQRSGVEEREHPSCPATSEIGHTSAGYGVGQALTYAPGRLYLAGPYHGSPLSVVAIDPALVGPFDLGVVIVRSAVRIDPYSAQVSLDAQGSDPIPHIIDGIPIHLRDIRVYIDRPSFMLNPTSCEPLALSSTLAGSAAPFTNPEDITASVSDRFQAANCGALGFSPKLSFAVKGAKRAAFPELAAKVIAHPGEANVAAAEVTLPHAEFLAQQHIRTACTQPEFQAESCPPGSVYGSAEVSTPLLSEPLRGLVYLRSNNGERALPDLVVQLKGQGITIDLVGHIDSPHGGLRARFEGLPDAPFTRFALSMAGGKRGLLENSVNLCTKPQLAAVRLIGKANEVESYRTRLQGSCRHAKKRGHKRHGRRR